MSVVIGLAVAIYALGVTWVLFVLVRRLSRVQTLSPEISDLKLSELPVDKRIEALSKIAEIRRGEIPWYERGFSIIGVIGFFSMLLATGLQTVKASIEEQKVSRLEAQIQRLREESSGLKEVIGRVSRSILDQYRKDGVLDEGTKEVLRFRLSVLEDYDRKTESDIIEMFSIALVLRESSKAVSLFEENRAIFATADPSSLVSVAEHYFLLGNTVRAEETLAQVTSELYKARPAVRFRAIVLMTALDSKYDEHAREVAALLRIHISVAKRRLTRETEILEDSARRLGS